MRAFLALIVLLAGLSPAFAQAQTSDVSPRFALTDHTGRAVTQADFAGRFLLLTFGYTACPDVCPTGLQTMAATLDALGPEAGKVRAAFITVDPQRDTPAQLSGYVALFHKDLIGLTGDEPAIADVAKQMRVKYAKVVVRPEDPDAYAMDHTASFFLIGPDGRLLDRLPHRLPPEKLAEKIVQRIRGGA
ncbi:SCO family protein [Azospirillum sp.]|uniref:SCO family protein n=1 Tax=Azospirillum sp. TaxID=34012 RepID=UPI003D73796F